uniref:Single domain-containing protein n=1 Tax=Amblyomma cajennense TaxID=34607 RepID=A0A023FMV7_AMBCJ
MQQVIHAKVFNSSGSLVFKNDTCIYYGVEINDGDYVTLHEPCELWWCSAKKGYLTVHGCERPLHPPRCDTPYREDFGKCCQYSGVC